VIEFLAIAFGPLLAWVVWVIAIQFRTPEYDRAKRHDPGHYL
jgi:hypothetical protein